MISDTRATVGEALVVLVAVGAERADVVERAGFEAEQVLAVDELGPLGALRDSVDHRLVEARRHEVDHLHARRELGVLAWLATLPETKMPRWPIVWCSV